MRLSHSAPSTCKGSSAAVLESRRSSSSTSRPRRMELFRCRLAKGESVTAAIYGSGFGSSSRLYERASEQLGMTPAELRGGAKDVKIRFTIAASPLGKMLIAVSEAGLCAVAFGSLESELEDASCGALSSFPGSAGTSRGLGSAIKQVLAHMSEHPVALDLPLDLRATAIPGSRLAGAPADSARRDAQLRANRPRNWTADSGARRGPGLRHKHRCCRHTMPSRGRQRRQAHRIPLGNRT